MKITLALILLFVSVPALTANYKIVGKKVGSVQIDFVKNADVELNEKAEEKFYSQKADYALIQQMAPLNSAHLKSLQVSDLRILTMEEFNQIYARLSSGPMPFGDYNGYIMQKPPVYEAVKKRILARVKTVSALSSITSAICQRDAEDCLFEFIWKGKRFYKKDDMDQIETRSAINLGSSGFKFFPNFLQNKLIDRAADFTEGVIDLASITLFPMHTYCGISQVDTRRESIITDGGFADDFKSYSKLRDEVITRTSLNITEEYRMLRPGLYIGKVYSNKLFLFNLVLEKTGSAPQTETANACFDGTKTR